MRKIILLAFFLVCLLNISAIELTPEEQAWIKSHPRIELGIGNTWEPFIFPDPEGDHEGFDADMINLINEILGTNIVLVPGNWNDIVEMAKRKELDGLAESTTTGDRKQYFNFTDVYINTYYAIVTTPDKVNEFENKDDIRKKKFSYLKGNAWLDKLMNSLGIENRLATDTERQAVKMVMEGKADGCFIAIGSYSEMRKIFFDNISIAHALTEDEYKLDIVYSIRKDWPELVSMINKALAEITIQEKNKIFEKWVGISLDEYMPWNKLTAEEQHWLQKHPVIRIAPDRGTPPIEWFDENDEYKGITSEFVNAIADILNIQFEIVKCKTWNEVLDKAKSREVDIIPAATQTPERSKYMLDSDPYLTLHGVIITRNENKKYSTTNELNGKKVGVVSGYIWHESFIRDYPEINIVAVSDAKEGLIKVSIGEIDAFVGILPIALYNIEHEGIHNLIVTGETEYSTEISFLVRKDWPVLHSIISKTLKNIPEEKKKEIISKWINLTPVTIFSNNMFWAIIFSVIGVSLLFVILISIWNSALKKKVKQKTDELRISQEKYKLMIDNQVDMLVKVDLDGKFLYVSPSYCEVFGKSEAELLGKNFMPLVHEEDQNTTEEEMKKLFHEPYSCYLEQRAKTKEGWRWLSWRDSSVMDETGNVIEIIGLGRDITDRKKAEQMLQVQSDVMSRIIKGQNLAEALDYFTEQLDKILSGWLSSVFKVSPDKKYLLPIAGHNVPEPWIELMNPLKIGENTGSCGTSAHLGERVIVEDISTDPKWEIFRKNALENGLKACWSQPIFSTKEKTLLGTFAFYFSEPRKVNDEDLSILQSVSAFTTIIMEHAFSLDELADHRENLEELVNDRTKELNTKNEELERLNKLFIGREFRIKELKERLKELEEK